MTSMRSMLGAAILGAACATTGAFAQSVNVQFKDPAQLTGYRTYRIAKLQATDAPIEPRLAAAIDRDLQKKGWHAVSSGGDVLVTAVLANDHDRRQFRTFYNGLENTLPDLRSTMADGESPVNLPGGTLIVDMYDSHTGALIWRSTATDFLTGNLNENEIKVDTAVNRMFDALPWDDTPNGFKEPIEVDD